MIYIYIYMHIYIYIYGSGRDYRNEMSCINDCRDMDVEPNVVFYVRSIRCLCMDDPNSAAHIFIRGLSFGTCTHSTVQTFTFYSCGVHVYLSR
jgi:hypothetical protein